MNDPNMTRRDAVKLGGTALVGGGLSAGAFAAGPAEPAPAKPTEYPDFRGKTVLFYARAVKTTQTFSDPTFVMLGGRLFVTGTIPALGYWTDGLAAAVAWDSVETYIVFNSVEECQARWHSYREQKQVKAE